MAAAAKVWEGDAALRRLLVPVGELHTFEGNPRVGDLDAIAASLTRFGQYRPIVVGADGAVIAGNHTLLAARDGLGWTHIAAVRVGLEGDEARAALLTDNRVSELGSFDLGLLAEHVAYLADLDQLAGTGYTTDDLDGFLAELSALGDETVDVSFQARAGRTLVCPACGHQFQPE